MYYKVFIGASELIFVKKHQYGVTYTEFNESNDEFDEWLEALRLSNSANKYYILDEEGVWQKSFEQKHSIIEAAGGLVENENGELLVIERLGKWDLPKGKMEKGESPEYCAIREVEEECGLNDLKIENELESTFHTYPLKGQNILKRTYWFKMRASSSQLLCPQTEEGITKVLFMDKNQVEKASQNTYQSLLPLFKTYLARNK